MSRQHLQSPLPHGRPCCRGARHPEARRKEDRAGAQPQRRSRERLPEEDGGKGRERRPACYGGLSRLREHPQKVSDQGTAVARVAFLKGHSGIRWTGHRGGGPGRGRLPQDDIGQEPRLVAPMTVETGRGRHRRCMESAAAAATWQGWEPSTNFPIFCLRLTCGFTPLWEENVLDTTSTFLNLSRLVLSPNL